MDISSSFITVDVLDILFKRLSYEDKISFSQVNNFTYQTYHTTVKDIVYRSINDDYPLFKRCFQRFTYSEEEINKLGIDAVQGIRTIRMVKHSYYDLRFIFELIYHGLDSDNSDKHKIIQIMMEKIKQCISFSRFETIHNINHEMILYSLHTMFSGEKRIKGIKNNSMLLSKWVTI